MDSQIEQLVKSCSICQDSRPAPPPAPLHPWEWPSEPWSRLHIDYFGPFLNHMFMVVVDAHSKWIEACVMPSITAAKTIEQLRIIFATHGLPRMVVTDNGPSYTSEEFASFLSYNGIVHVTSAPYHPPSNSLAEQAVQTLKSGLKCTSGATIQEKLSRVLRRIESLPRPQLVFPPLSSSWDVAYNHGSIDCFPTSLNVWKIIKLSRYSSMIRPKFCKHENFSIYGTYVEKDHT